ncbi:hypothetical protein ACIBHY_49035 [Nonomuraea sp. NPDC050547]|uniref:hypothetical protein n=1 Tax=unclassified Nonomuraea TaxID=2593643 RepID=UPI0037AB692F
MHAPSADARAVQATRVEWEPWDGTRAVPEERGDGVRGSRAVPEEPGDGVGGTRDASQAQGTRDGQERSAGRVESGEEGPVKVEELVETVYELLVRRLRADSRLDRERRGLSMGSRF